MPFFIPIEEHHFTPSKTSLRTFDQLLASCSGNASRYCKIPIISLHNGRIEPINIPEAGWISEKNSLKNEDLNTFWHTSPISGRRTFTPTNFQTSLDLPQLIDLAGH